MSAPSPVIAQCPPNLLQRVEDFQCANEREDIIERRLSSEITQGFETIIGIGCVCVCAVKTEKVSVCVYIHTHTHIYILIIFIHRGRVAVSILCDLQSFSHLYILAAFFTKCSFILCGYNAMCTIDILSTVQI